MQYFYGKCAHFNNFSPSPMPGNSPDTHPLADVIEYFVEAERRSPEDVRAEMQELAALYNNVMHHPLPEASPTFTTKDRTEAIRVMRHYLPKDDDMDEEQPANDERLAA